MPEETSTTSERRWVWAVLGIVVAIVCLYLLKSPDTGLGLHYDCIDRLYREGRLFGYVLIPHMVQTDSVGLEMD